MTRQAATSLHRFIHTTLLQRLGLVTLAIVLLASGIVYFVEHRH